MPSSAAVTERSRAGEQAAKQYNPSVTWLGYCDSIYFKGCLSSRFYEPVLKKRQIAIRNWA
jgi:hypothetical protein